MQMEEEQVENTNMAENQNDTNVIQAEDQNNTNVMDSEDNQGKNAQVMTSPCTDPQTNRNNQKRNARRHLGLAPLGGARGTLNRIKA